jgi:DNA anti-recombination protein RmuC
MSPGEVSIEYISRRLDDLQREAAHNRQVGDVILKQMKALYAEFDAQRSRLDLIDGRLDRMEASFGERLDRMEASFGERLDRMEASFGERLDRMEASFGERLDRMEACIGERLELVEQTLERILEKLH